MVDKNNAAKPPTIKKKATKIIRKDAKVTRVLAKKPDSEFEAIYPFRSNWHFINGHKYHYLDEGKDEVVVMVHGNPTWSFFYRNLVIGLRNDFRCLVPDHIGCGFSDKPQKYAYTLSSHIDNLEKWLEDILPPADSEQGRINMVVHDWGGPIGLGYATRHPERIKKVVVLNTSAFLDGSMPRSIRMCRWPVVGELLIRGLNAFALAATKKTTVSPLEKSVAAGYLKPYNSWKNRIALHAFVKDIPLDASIPSHAVLANIAKNIQKTLKDQPMLIQWGMNDWCFTPFFLNLWQRYFPDAGIDKYNAGHYLLEDEGGKIIPRIKSFLLERD